MQLSFKDMETFLMKLVIINNQQIHSQDKLSPWIVAWISIRSINHFHSHNHNRQLPLRQHQLVLLPNHNNNSKDLRLHLQRHSPQLHDPQLHNRRRLHVLLQVVEFQGVHQLHQAALQQMPQEHLQLVHLQMLQLEHRQVLLKTLQEHNLPLSQHL